MDRLAALLCRTVDLRSDGDLLAAFLADRDEAAFTELVRRHGPLVWGVCRRALPDPADAEDVFQATFLVLVRRATRLTAAPTVGPWLYQVAALTARNARRKNARRRARFVPLPDQVPAPPQPGPSLDLDAVLLGLPERCRAAILLCHVEGLTHREAAQRLGCPEGTVSSLVSRGLARAKLGGGGDPAMVLAAVAVAMSAGVAAATVRSAVALQLASLSVAASPAVVSLTAGVLRMLWFHQLTAPRSVLIAAVLVGCLLGAGFTGWAITSGGEKPVTFPGPFFGPNSELKPTERTELTAGEEREFEIGPRVKMKFCWIPAGEAQLGSPKAEREYILNTYNKSRQATPDVTPDGLLPTTLENEAEEKRGKFKTKGFWLGKYSVTQEEWKAVTGKNPSTLRPDSEDVVIRDLLLKEKINDTARYPVDFVNWDDCQQFLKKLNSQGGNAMKVFGHAGKFALPHEDEWEYACRGGKGNDREFYWGEELNGAQANCIGVLPYKTETKGPDLRRMCAVDDTNGGKYPKHPWGLFHMHGNIWQWCENKYDDSTDDRVLRGGSWNYYPYDCRAASRAKYGPSARNSNFGGVRICFRPD